MAILRTYDAQVTQLGPLAHWRFGRTDTAAVAVDRAGDLDGAYRNGATADAAGVIGDGAASFDGRNDYVLVQSLSGAYRVAVLGDSLARSRFVGSLEVALDGLGLDATTLNHAVSGERSDQGLARLGQVIADAPDAVILELGTNDAIQTRPTSAVEADLQSIVAQLQDAGIEVLVTGQFGFYPDRGGGVGYATHDERDDSKRSSHAWPSSSTSRC